VVVGEAEDTWPRLLKNLGEIKDDAISYDWKLEAYAEEDTPPSDSAQEKKKLVHAAICGMKPERDRDENGFDKTIFDILDAWAKGTSVLEVDWEQRDGPAGEMIAPRATIWVHPRHYAWSQEGFLGLVASEATPTVYQPTPLAVMPMPDHKFLIALCKSRSTHVLGAALLRPLAWWWCAANFSAEWLLNYAQIFGLPIRWAFYREGAPQALLDTISDMLENMGSAAWGMFPEGTTLELKEASKSGDALPQGNMLDRADKQCDLLILRQTLTSDVTDSGSRALGQVHERGRDKEVSGATMFAADVLQQLVESVLILNYGNADEAPRFCPEPRQEEDVKANSEVIQAAVNMGVKVPLKWAHKKLGIPLPQADEEILEAQSPEPISPTGPIRPMLPNNGNGNGSPRYDFEAFKARSSAVSVVQPDATDQVVKQAVADAVGAREEWLAPLNDELDRLARLARNKKISDAELTGFIELAARRLPDLFSELKPDVLADSLEASLGAAVLQAVRDDVAAEKPA
jgi:phage gp29-like protein